MRNIPVALSVEEWKRVRAHVSTLAQAFNDDVPVELRYIKRNGQASSSMGKVNGFSGKAGFDTFSVEIVDVAKGIRTINLVGLREIIL